MFAGKVIYLLFNTLSSFSSKEQTSMGQLLSTVILEPEKTKSFTISIVSQSISQQVMGPDAMIFVL